MVCECIVCVVGVVMGLLQSVTQIQEQTLAFVPKFAAVGVVIAVAGEWMLHLMVGPMFEYLSSTCWLLYHFLSLRRPFGLPLFQFALTLWRLFDDR